MIIGFRRTRGRLSRFIHQFLESFWGHVVHWFFQSPASAFILLPSSLYFRCRLFYFLLMIIGGTGDGIIYAWGPLDDI